MAILDNTSFSMMVKGMDAAWYKQQITLQNIANDSTPDYKAKNVSFSAVLKEAVNSKSSLLTKAAVDANLKNPIGLRVTTTTEPRTNQTLDENNVDMEKEQVTLSDMQYMYSTLTNKVNGEFSMIRSAIQR